jgi:uncharacterized protein
MIIDGHTHINRRSWERGGGLSDFDQNGVDLIVGMIFDFALCPSPGNPQFWKAKNEELAEISAESSGRVVALCSVHPKDGPAAILEIRRAVNDRKMKGIKLHPHQNNFTVCSDEIYAISTVAGDLEVPVFFHCCYQPLVTPAQIGIMAKECPKTIFVLGHTGWNNEWQVAIAVSRRYDNIFMCTSGLNYGATKEVVQRCDQERIFFGSDFPCGGAETQRYELEKIRSLELSPKLNDRILHENIMRLLRLEVPHGKR